MAIDLTPAERTTEALDRAQLLLAANLVGPAERCLDEVLLDHPEHPEARLLHARLRLRRHEPRLARPASTNAAAHAALAEASRYAAAGKVDLAMISVSEALGERPDDLALRRALAGLQLHAGLINEAAESLRRVMALDPRDRAAGRLRCGLLAETEPGEALAALGAVDETSCGRAARLCVKLERWAEAEAYTAAWLSVTHPDKDGVRVWLDAAAVAEAMGEMHRALERLAVVTVTEAELPAEARAEAWRRIGRLRLLLGDTARAGRAYFAATRFDAEDAEAWSGLVLTAQTMDRPRLRGKADARLKAVAERTERRRLLARLQPFTTPGSGDEHQDEAAAQHSPLQRMLSESAAVMRQTAERFPNRADVHFHRAVIDSSRGEYAEVGASLDQALQINPRYAAARAMADALAGDGAEWELVG
jgi:tetratricopeptide (TPR) repeat protein